MAEYTKPTFTKTQFILSENISKCTLTKGPCKDIPGNQENQPDGGLDDES